MKQKLGFLCAVLLLSCLLAAPSFAEDAEELICKGWFLPPNTYDCGSFVVN